MQRRRAAVLRGRVLAQDGRALEKVKVRVDGPPVAQTLTRADGGFDLAVNGGGPLVVLYNLKGYLSARRPVAVPWQDYVVLADVVLAPAPARAGALDVPLPETLPGAAPSVRGEPTGGDAPRQATFVAPPGFTAGIAYPTNVAPLKGKLTLSVREYTAGPRDAALPAPPPPGTGCVYAFELTAEEARQASDRGAVFNPSLAHYIDNFLKLPVGTELPTYRYDVGQLRWVAGPVGRVVRVEDMTTARNDAPSADAPGSAERKAVEQLYADKAQTLWRLPLTGTGAWAVCFPVRPPDGAAAPPWDFASVAADAADAPKTQPVSESLPVAGTPFTLHYGSDRAPGHEAPYPARRGAARPGGSEGAEAGRPGNSDRRPPPHQKLSARRRPEIHLLMGRPRRLRPARAGAASGDGADRLRLRRCISVSAGMRTVARAAGDARRLGRALRGAGRLDPERPPHLRPDRPRPAPRRRRAARRRR